MILWTNNISIRALSVLGTVHQKIEISVIVYSPSRSKPVWMSLFHWTQRKIFRRMWETEFLGYCIFIPTMEVNCFYFVDISANILMCTFIEQHSFKVKDCLRRLRMLFQILLHHRVTITYLTQKQKKSHYICPKLLGQIIHTTTFCT